MDQIITVAGLDGPNGSPRKFRLGIKKTVLLSDLRDTYGPGRLIDSEGFDINSSDDVLAAGKYRYDLISGSTCSLAGELPQAPQRWQSFVREAANNYNGLLSGEKEEKFLRVSRDPFGDLCEDPSLIWIRKCYTDLKKVLLETIEHTLFRRFVILGTAGIGKSVFTIFWVCYLATKGVKVAWKTHPTQIYILDFSQKVATVSGPFADLNHLAIRSVVEDPKAWLILDGQQPDPLPYECHMLLACSIRKSNHHEFLKNSLTKRLFLPVWTKKEVDQFCDDFSLYQESYGAMDVPVKKKVQANFKELGGVPRFVLKNERLELGRDQFQTAVNQLTADQCWNLLSGSFEQGVSDKIIHICVRNVEGKWNYDKCVYTFASSKAKDSVWEHLRSKKPAELSRFISDNWDSPQFETLVGGMYEKASIEILKRGGTFKRKRVYEESPFVNVGPNLVLGELDSSYFDDLKELKTMKYSTCYMPTSTNFESVDAVISPASSGGVTRLVQIFKRKKGRNYGYKLEGLQNVDDVLKGEKYELLSCVPSACYNETKFQTWRTKGGTKVVRLTKALATLVAKTDQYVVEVDYNALLTAEASV